MWIDSHCHVTADRFDEDREAVLERAFAGGIDRLVSIGSGYGLEGNADAIALAESDSRIFATVGVHPTKLRSSTTPIARRSVKVWRMSA